MEANTVKMHINFGIIDVNTATFINNTGSIVNKSGSIVNKKGSFSLPVASNLNDSPS